MRMENAEKASNPPSDIIDDPNKKKVKRKRKEKKKDIIISLYINGIAYESGLLCTFCAKIQAVSHCPECTDFYCATCDTTAHNTKKRKFHIRKALSKLNLDAAAGLITRTVRRFGYLRLLQRICRVQFKRIFDRKTLNYYYFNTRYGTSSWRKPYCLRGEELLPYMTPEYAAAKMQNLYRLWRARERVRNFILAQYRKIFDRSRCEFYYAFNGRSRLLPRSSWRKPRMLGKRSFPKDLVPIYTIDVAAIAIQRKWRAILMWQFLRALSRAVHDEVWDPVHGRYNYYNRDHEILLQSKPNILRNEPWDVNRVTDWSVDRVSIFLRRLGLKQYVQTMKDYGVDGNTLYLLDDEDFVNLEIHNRIHIRRIRVELDRIFTPTRPIIMSRDHETRREKIRRHKMFTAAAILVQTQFRRFKAQKDVTLMREVRRIRRAEARLQSKIKATDIWWTEHANLPSKKMAVLPSYSSTGVRLPPIKTFGRRRDYLSYRGWGRRGNDLNGTWTPSPAALIDPSFMGDSHPTLVFSEKLNQSGYDDKRRRIFLESIL